MNWSWLTSPLGITVLVVVILVAATLVYWKRKPILRWLRRWKLSEVEVGPVKFKHEEKTEPPAPAGTGVNFGAGNDFTGATIRDVAGRDIRRGSAAVSPSGGKAPGVDFGRQGQFRDAEITDVAGRDIVED